MCAWRGRSAKAGRRGDAGDTMTKPNPKLLFSTAPWFRRPLREAFQSIVEAGFESVEVMVTQDPATQEPHLLRDLASEFGLTVEAITNSVGGRGCVGGKVRSGGANRANI